MTGKSKTTRKSKPRAKVKLKPSGLMGTAVEARRNGSRSAKANQFTYMKPPGSEHDFMVGDAVEVYCDHEKNNDRIRGWIKGIVVQMDSKMVAVQFRSNVYLTDGWMVPDRILWYPVHSEHLRQTASKKALRKIIPEY
jgi:hypothetical protein